METKKWETQKVYGRDKVLQDIQKRATFYSNEVVQDVRDVMHDYEVDMYRLVLKIGKHFGMEKAYEIMSETVADKRLRWVEQVKDELDLTGIDVENGLNLYRKYFKLSDESFQILKQSDGKVVFKRKDFIDAIAYACSVLDLDVIDVNNKVYARTMNLIFQKINLDLKNTVLEYHDGWYVEMIEIDKN
ncbi:MAG: hypothetical protein IH585_07020 [Anaerolineaceae bacterium]|nr:hypothetical protein [Anaerolineaceae bacterium]